ncbi:hypothetical protein F4778DRAFT_737140 [Xylariomycetidae sp. FL2044]|nr:hypothetical protein F4778DRAFT_737140 [Xylariomycetidae sp. FL2044]
MCFQMIEVYSVCRCLYYQHPVDRCSAYGRAGHGVTRRTILVGYTCKEHSEDQLELVEGRNSSYQETTGGYTSHDLAISKRRPRDSTCDTQAPNPTQGQKLPAPDAVLVSPRLEDKRPKPQPDGLKYQTKASEGTDLAIQDLSSRGKKLMRPRNSKSAVESGAHLRSKGRHEEEGKEEDLRDEPPTSPTDVQAPPADRFREREAHSGRAEEEGAAYFTSIMNFLRVYFHNALHLLNESTAAPGCQRLHWACECGLESHDDYEEVRAGALDDLKQVLYRYGVIMRSSADLESNIELGDLSTAANPPSPAAPSRKPFEIRWPWQQQQARVCKPGSCLEKSQSGSAEHHDYLLACLPFGRYVSRILQPEVCTIRSDQDFFSLLKLLYNGNRRRLSLSLLRRVKGIHFVQFDMLRTEVADIRSHPALPPEGLKDQYMYNPMPADLMPPVGPNLLAHFFDHPKHASALPDLYQRIPKKLREKLTPCQVTGMSTGWGIQFVEGIDPFAFFLCGCACFLLCLLIAVVWTSAKQDVQGGFGIGGFVLAFMVFCGGVVHSSIES